MLSDDSAREYIFGRGGSLEFPVSGGRQNRNVAGVSRQLDHRLHARRDRRRLGRELRSHAAQVVHRRHRCGANLPRGDARRDQTSARRGRLRSARHRRGTRRPGRARSLRALRHAGKPLVPSPSARAAAGRTTSRRAAGTTRATKACSSCGRRPFVSGLDENGLLSERRTRRRHRRTPVREPDTTTVGERLPPCPSDPPEVPSRSSTRRPARPTSSIPRCAGSSRRLPLRVVAATPGTIEWQVAGRVVGTSSTETALMWPLTPGRPPHHRARRARAGGGELGGGEVAKS